MEVIKKLIDNQIDESIHGMFVRFSKGVFEDRFSLNIKKSKDKLDIRGSYDTWLELFNIIIKESNEVNVVGRLFKNRKKEDYEGSLNSDDVKKIVGENDFALLDITAGDYLLKCKKALPKPGKKLNIKFCSAKLPLSALDTLAFDFKDKKFKQAEIRHTVVVNEIILPEGEEDPVLLRLNSKRKGKIIRKINLDGNETITEFEFIA